MQQVARCLSRVNVSLKGRGLSIHTLKCYKYSCWLQKSKKKPVKETSRMTFFSKVMKWMIQSSSSCHPHPVVLTGFISSIYVSNSCFSFLFPIVSPLQIVIGAIVLLCHTYSSSSFTRRQIHISPLSCAFAWPVFHYNFFVFRLSVTAPISPCFPLE